MTMSLFDEYRDKIEVHGVPEKPYANGMLFTIWPNQIKLLADKVDTFRVPLSLYEATFGTCTPSRQRTPVVLQGIRWTIGGIQFRYRQQVVKLTRA